MTPAERQMQFVFTLRSAGVTDGRVLQAMEAVPRGDYVIRLNDRRLLTGLLETTGLAGEGELGSNGTVSQSLQGPK